MTAPRPTAHSSISRYDDIESLYNLAVAFVLANQDASCSGLQRHFRIGYSLALQLQKRLKDNGVLNQIESQTEPAKVMIQVVKQPGLSEQAVVNLIASDESGSERLAATSMPMPTTAAQRISALYDKPDTITPTFPSLQAVLSKTGKLAWASAGSSTSNAATDAALDACAKLSNQGVDLSTVNTILIITAMTPDNQFINVIKTVFTTVRAQIQADARMATAIIIDDHHEHNVEVQLLVTGLPT